MVHHQCPTDLLPHHLFKPKPLSVCSHPQFQNRSTINTTSISEWWLQLTITIIIDHPLFLYHRCHGHFTPSPPSPSPHYIGVITQVFAEDSGPKFRTVSLLGTKNRPQALSANSASPTTTTTTSSPSLSQAQSGFMLSTANAALAKRTSKVNWWWW